MSWYTTSYRRNLVDMHIEDWDDAFLSEFSPEAYYDCLVRAGIDAPMIYFQSHVGLCYWPTVTGQMHRAFAGREDAMRRLVELCRAGGMHVVGYYSLNYNTREHDAHPDWRMLRQDGRSRRAAEPEFRYGLCCPNNPDYRAFVYAQIDELAAYFTVDGMFYDMPFWPHPCYCAHCKKRFRDETGYDLPETENWGDPVWLLFMRRHEAWMGEFAQAVTAHTKAVMPGVSVEQNYASALTRGGTLGCTESVNAACDYTGGDLYGDFYHQSFTCKFYRAVSQNQPFEFMTCRCDNFLSEHTVTKSEEDLRLSVMLTCAHHGATLLIDAIDPVGTLDARLYDAMGRIFEAEVPYEPHLTGTPLEDVAVYYALNNKYAGPDGLTNHDCAVGAHAALVQAHVPCGILGKDNLDRIAAFKLVVLPHANELEDDVCDALLSYVEGGGKLYLSGGACTGLLSCLGIGLDGATASTRTYVAPMCGGEVFGDFNEKYPVPFGYALPEVRMRREWQVLAKLALPYTAPGEPRFSSIHSNPPGIVTECPAMAQHSYGKGTVLWTAAAFECEERFAYRSIFTRLVRGLLGAQELAFTADAPRRVEVLAYRTERGYTCSLADLLYAQDPSRLPGFAVRIRTECPARAVRRVPDGAAVPFSHENGYTCIELSSLELFDMYEIIC